MIITHTILIVHTANSLNSRRSHEHSQLGLLLGMENGGSVVSVISWRLLNLLEVRQHCSPEGARPPLVPGHTASPPCCHLPYGLAKKISPPWTQLFSHTLFTRTQPSGLHLSRTHKRDPGGPLASKHIEFSDCEPYLSRGQGTPRKRINNTLVLTESQCVSGGERFRSESLVCVYIYVWPSHIEAAGFPPKSQFPGPPKRVGMSPGGSKPGLSVEIPALMP